MAITLKKITLWRKEVDNKPGPNCGVASFYIPRSDPDAFDVNVRCLEGVSLSKLEYDYFDGRNWERAFHDREQARAAK